MAEGGDEIVSMVDVLEEGKQMEEEAAAVLGDSDDKCCTYPLGYVNRQALYACMTCKEKNQTMAGICLACSYECHEGHEFVELYTKRDFCCDCGNAKFPNMTCKLIKNKPGENTENKYNHNFAGVYCICERPYPDPEDEIEDEMIQCVVCEDWFHGRHLGASKVPENEEYQEMVCLACMGKCDFLWSYTVHSLGTKIVKEETSSEVDVTSQGLVEVKTQNPASSSSQITMTNPPSSTVLETSQLPPIPQTSDATISSSSSSMDSALTATKNETVATSEAIAGPAGDGVSSSTNNGCVDKLSENNFAVDVKHDGGDVVATSSASSTATSSNAATEQQPATEGDVETSTPLDTTSDSMQASSVQTEASDADAPKQEKADIVDTFVDDASGSKTEGGKGSVMDNIAGGSGSSSAGKKEETEGNIVCCRLKELKRREVQKNEGAVFWPLGWRTKLCACPECKEMYSSLQVTFLLDPSDAVVAYEERGKGKRRSLYGQGMEALSSMNRVQQVEMLHGYADMKSALSDFLKSFADQGKVVTASDIQEFYNSLNRKRQRVGSASSVQYLCR